MLFRQVLGQALPIPGLFARSYDAPMTCSPGAATGFGLPAPNPNHKWYSPDWHAIALSALVQPTELRTCPDTIGFSVLCAYVAEWNRGECGVVCYDQAKVFGT